MSSHLPKDFISRIQTQFGGDAEQLLSAIDRPVHTSIHLHPTKGQMCEWQGEEVPWFPNGRILLERPSFTLDPIFHGGAYYPQESSSMFLGWALKQILTNFHDPLVLDLCAAPGGKSILASTLIGANGRLVSNEIIKSRNAILRENLTKWGASNTIVTCNDPSQFAAMGETFDIIVLDAPCSGEGMFRKDLNARDEWSLAHVELCSARQQRIFEDAAAALNEGGYVIYSTCTFAPEENEQNVKRWIDTGNFETVALANINFDEVDVVESNGVHAYRFLPHRSPGEGFFLCVLKKIRPNDHSVRSKPKPIYQVLSKKDRDRLPSWIELGQLDCFQDQFQQIWASPFRAEELNRFAQHVYITSAGVESGQWMKNDFVPAHALALSGLCKGGIFDYEIPKDEALSYLRGDAIFVEGERGWARILHKSIPLGWVKIIPGRTNNYYPKEWRIKMRG